MNLEGLAIWAGLGLVIGVIAKYIMPGKDGVGLITTSLVGIIGSVVGVFVANLLGMTASFGELGIMTLLFSIVGALIVLIVLKLIKFIV